MLTYGICRDLFWGMYGQIREIQGSGKGTTRGHQTRDFQQRTNPQLGLGVQAEVGKAQVKRYGQTFELEVAPSTLNAIPQ